MSTAREHPLFDSNLPPETVLWRYMDFPRFVSMLHHKALYFSRSDLLGDPLEGSFTKSLDIRRQALLDNPPDGRTREDLESTIRHNSQVAHDSLQRLYINCWHRGDHESMALWQGYGSGPYAIAIRATFGLLNKLLPEKFSGTGVVEGGAPAEPDDVPPKAMPIWLTQVRYVDHGSTEERVEENNMMGPFTYKSVVYKHENEVRAIYWNIPDFDTATGKAIYPSGLRVPVDLQALVTSVVVSPLAPVWFTDVVRSAFSRYGFDFQVRPSLGSATPVF